MRSTIKKQQSGRFRVEFSTLVRHPRGVSVQDFQLLLPGASTIILQHPSALFEARHPKAFEQEIPASLKETDHEKHPKAHSVHWTPQNVTHLDVVPGPCEGHVAVGSNERSNEREEKRPTFKSFTAHHLGSFCSHHLAVGSHSSWGLVEGKWNDTKTDPPSCQESGSSPQLLSEC